MISPIIRSLRPEPDAQQLAVIGHGDGPLQVVAGPGSGKTTSVSRRAANLVLTGRAQPQELVLCTFTQEAAREMRRRFTETLQAASYAGDLSRVVIRTIHSLCHRLLSEYGDAIGLRPGYRLLSTAEQLDLMEANLERIFGPDRTALADHGDRWSDPQRAAQEARKYFDRISDDLIDPNLLITSRLPFQAALGRSYLRYQQVLWDGRAVDFAHLQTWALALLENPRVCARVGAGVRHLLVDEYQDTSLAQEQLLLRLGSEHGNICVVGDEDQSIYRFRGARVENMMGFAQRFPGCRVLHLTNNYRSHRDIVAVCNRWMESCDWTNPLGSDYRFPKTIVPRAADAGAAHDSVVSVVGQDKRDEARRLAEFLAALQSRGFIADYDDVAILLPSVRWRYSQPYLDALREAGVPAHLAPARHHPEEIDVGRSQPPDNVLLTTIHQAKGREWPVVVVALPRQFRQWPDRFQRDLDTFRAQSETEPPDRADEFDLMRQYYVAFSRAQHLLALSGTVPDRIFFPLLRRVRRWPEVDLGRWQSRHDSRVGSDRGITTVTHRGPLTLQVSNRGLVRIALSRADYE